VCASAGIAAAKQQQRVARKTKNENQNEQRKERKRLFFSSSPSPLLLSTRTNLPFLGREKTRGPSSRRAQASKKPKTTRVKTHK
jgi:hypothetical protein